MVHGFENLEKLGYPKIKNVKTNQCYKICLIDLMLLKRQKLEAITLTGQLKADGVEVDMVDYEEGPLLHLAGR